MSDVRNYEEYRAQALASLGEDYTVEDLRNEERFRSKVLDGLGVSYETEDLVNFEKYRLKVLQGLAGGGGGGSSDFSTAEITFINSDTTTKYTVYAFALDEESKVVNNVTFDVFVPTTLKIPIGDNGALLPLTAFGDIDPSVMPTTTGAVNFSQSGVLITGDGTFTAKGVGIIT